jgi:hypothetical protein
VYGLSKKGVKMRDTDDVEPFLKEYVAFAEFGTITRFIVLGQG